MKFAVKLICSLALTLLGAFSLVRADVPEQMNVQGRLTNGAGAPVPAGLKLLTFKIFDAAAGGTEIWPAAPGETQTLSTDANGLWTACVGQLIPLTEAVFLNPVRYLEVTVNDGVNPPETLPRIELKTVPYTYRAATSQHADSLGNLTFADLVDQFVNEAADTMSGQLRVDWDNTGAGPDLELENINNGYPSTWFDVLGTWGASIDANADNGAYNIGLAAAAQGDNMRNYGVYGVARGTNSVNYGVYGEAGLGASNYAGYFDGDLAVLGSSLGDASVFLPSNAISSAEILDEPGIAHSRASLGSTLTIGASMTDLEVISITTPATGYLLVRGHTGIEMGVTVGGGYCYVQIDETAGGSQTVPYWTALGGSNPGANIDFSADAVRVYSKLPGTYTFRLEALSSYVGTTRAYNPTLTVEFIPTAYGAVTTLVESREASEFESAKPISLAGSPDGAGRSSNQDLFQVDLRELELKAAKAVAEAEKARRELAEAQVKAIRRPGQAPAVVGEEHKQ